MAAAIDWSQLLAPGYETIEEMLHNLYVEKEMSLRDIALFLGINRTPLARRLKLAGIPVRRKGRPIDTGKAKYNFREARPDGFSETSRENEKRDCKNFADCLCIAAVKDDYCLPCVGCNGEPQMNYFLMHKHILEFQDHHTEGVRHGAWHPTDRIEKHSFDLNKPSDVRKLIKKHNLSDRPMSASDFRYFRYTTG